MATDTATLTITVDATVVANDDTATTEAGQQAVVNVLANDLVNGATPTIDDLDGPPTIVSVTPEGAGTAAVNANGAVVFNPAEGFCGEVEIVYEIVRTCDGNGG